MIASIKHQEVSPFESVTLDQEEYNASCLKYERLANLKLRNSDTIVLGGYGCFVKVRNDAFVVEYQRPHEPGNDKILRLSRGTHKIKQIIFLAHGGYVTFDALEWCCQQNITVYLMDYRGTVLQVLTPQQPRNARLAYLQCKVSESDLSLSISIELIRKKTLSQIATLEKYPQLKDQSRAMDILEHGLHELHTVQSTDELRRLEGKLAMAYFSVFTDFPIRWNKQSAKIVPEHWTSITDRTSPLSHNHGAWHAINPYHCILNFALALLHAQVLQAIMIACLEPTVPFLHAYQEGKNALVWDLMECFRANVDHMVLQFFNKTIFNRVDFTQELTGEVRINNEELKRYVLSSCRINPIEIDRQVRWLRSTLECSL